MKIQDKVMLLGEIALKQYEEHFVHEWINHRSGEAEFKLTQGDWTLHAEWQMSLAQIPITEPDRERNEGETVEMLALSIIHNPTHYEYHATFMTPFAQGEAWKVVRYDVDFDDATAMLFKMMWA